MLIDTADAAEDSLTTAAPFDLDATFRAHYARVTRVIARVVQNPARTEELAVDVFVRLWREPKAQARPQGGCTVRRCARGSTSCGARPDGHDTSQCSDSRAGLPAQRRRPAKSADESGGHCSRCDGSGPRCYCFAATASVTMN